MSDLISENRAKITAYFDLIERHLKTAADRNGVHRSCYAALMLLFAIVDGLGKLFHDDVRVTVSKRFKFFLETKVGSEYKKNRHKIYHLRNAMVHNAISSIAYLSAVEDHFPDHLMEMRDNKYIFINTVQFCKDVTLAFQKCKDEVLKDDTKINAIGNRLMWNQIEYPYQGKVAPTLPPPIVFIDTKSIN
jgi:hypothetical protein